MSELDGSTFLVTGAAGLIGRALVPRLLAQGAKVRTADARPAPGIDLVGDLRDPAFARKAAEGCDGVAHLAGRRGSVGIQRTKAFELMSDNLALDRAVFAAMRDLKITRGVYASTVSIYPKHLDVYREELGWDGPPDPDIRYASWAKRMGEMLLEALAEEHGPHRIAVIRAVNTFGPYDDFDPATALVVAALIGKVEALRRSGTKDPLPVWGDGSAVRDVLFVDDLADGMVAAILRGGGKGAVNLGSGTGYTVKELVTAVLEACGESARPIAWDPSKPSGAPKKVADVTRAKELLGWSAKVPLVEGIRRTVAWYQERK